MTRNKTIITVIAVLGIIAFTGCTNKVSEEAQIVIDKINSIGTVDYDDEVLIGECEDAYIALTTEQQAEVNNTEVLAKAREEMDKLIAAKPIPFTTANWESTKDEVLNIVGSSPDEEYDSDDYHVLQYNSFSYDGYEGLVRYCFDDSNIMKQVLFVIDHYDEQAVSHFEEEFTTKYGKPEFENEAGKVWFQSNANVGVSSYKILSAGGVIVTFHEPTN